MSFFDACCFRVPPRFLENMWTPGQRFSGTRTFPTFFFLSNESHDGELMCEFIVIVYTYIYASLISLAFSEVW
jgi:hypothetical protein